MKPVSGHPFLKKVLPVSKLGLSLFLRFKDSFFCFSVFVAYWASLVAQMVKSPPAMQENWVQSLGWEDPLEVAIAAHYSILPWESLWTGEPGGLQSMGSHLLLLENKDNGCNYCSHL